MSYSTIYASTLDPYTLRHQSYSERTLNSILFSAVRQRKVTNLKIDYFPRHEYMFGTLLFENKNLLLESV